MKQSRILDCACKVAVAEILEKFYTKLHPARGAHVPDINATLKKQLLQSLKKKNGSSI